MPLSQSATLPYHYSIQLTLLLKLNYSFTLDNYTMSLQLECLRWMLQLQLLLLRRSLLKLYSGALQCVSVELAAVNRVLTDRADLLNEIARSRILLSCHFVVREDSRDGSGSTLSSPMCA